MKEREGRRKKERKEGRNNERDGWRRKNEKNARSEKE